MKKGSLLAAVVIFFAVSALAQVQAPFTLEPGPGNPRNSEGDFITLKDGRILFAYTHFTGDASDFGAAHIAGRFSTDQGRTWSSEDTLIVPNEGAINTMSVSFLRLASGQIALFYLRKEPNSDCRPYVRFSADEAATWTEPLLCIQTPGYYVVNNDRIIQLSTGRLVMPSACHSLDTKDYHGRAQALCYLSDDEGKTWRQGKGFVPGPTQGDSGLEEPGVLELKDGRLMMLSRTDLGCQYRSYSSDGGETWSPAEPTDILSPQSPATFERIPATGDILLVWNNHKDIPEDLKRKRTPLTLAVSRDEGQTWVSPINIETQPDGWYCYTALEFVPEAQGPGTALLAYCAGDKKVGGLNRIKIVRYDLTQLNK